MYHNYYTMYYRFQVIARGVIPDTSLIFKRRPATDALAYVLCLFMTASKFWLLFLLYSIYVDLGSFQVFGIATDSKQSELLNDSRPVLAKPSSSTLSNQQKLLQVEFETNPIDKKSDYRVKILTQSLEIKYNAVRISIKN